jgi:predicted negative regulator of RcsB-dependent stress response
VLRRHLCALGLCISPLALAAGPGGKAPPKDLYLGEAYFYAAQDSHFDAIARLDAELGQFYRLDDPGRDPLHYQVNQANFSVGDFELSYRMHQRAGRAIKAVLEGNVDEAIRNEAAWRLARIYMQKGDARNALQTVETIKGRIPEKIRNEESFLRAQIYIHTGKFPEAIALLQKLQGEKGYEGFARYNLAMALIQSGQEVQGLTTLEQAGQLKADDESALAIRDKSNLLLGNRLIAKGQADQAKQHLDRVRLSGPYSNKALLGSGWADASEGKFDRALVPWTLLIKRNVTDKAVQEGWMGVPHAYSKLKLYGRAAQLYGAALESFATELAKLDASLKSIREGKFLKALVRNELKQDRNWVIKLRELPETPETHYLVDLMASNDFQESLQNYFDLEDLRKRLTAWAEHLDAYEEVIQIRRQYYEGILPASDKQFNVLDSQMRLRIEQRQTLNERLQKLLVSPRPEFLETAEERVQREQLNLLAERYKDDSSESGIEARRRLQRLQGLQTWALHTTYNQRLTLAYKHLHQLDADVDRLNKIYRSYIRTRQAATQSYKGYDVQLRQLRIRVRDAREKVDTLMARQGNMLNVMAADELEQRRRRLEDYQVQARFALAENYDRASKQQESGSK